jgi:hypothetical protein
VESPSTQFQPKEIQMNTPTQQAALTALDIFVAAVIAPLVARIESLENSRDAVTLDDEESIDNKIAERVDEAMEQGNFKNKVVDIIEDYDMDDKVLGIVRDMSFSVSVDR